MNDDGDDDADDDVCSHMGSELPCADLTWSNIGSSVAVR